MAHHGGGGRPEHLVASIPARLREPEPSISFEFFPPKDDASEAQLWSAIRRLERVRPAFVSVTYGAGGTTQDRTVRVTGRIADETLLTPLAHLTCVNASVRQLRQVVGHYAASGVRNILALRGDPPGDVRGGWNPHPEGLDHAEHLVALVRGLGDFTVGVAAFPDVHPDSPDLDNDVEVLVRKADAGAEFAVTQMVFDADTYLRLRDRVAARRDLPVTPGLMPVTSLRQVTRMSELMGTPLPPGVVARLEAVKDDPDAVRAVGIDIASELGRRMLDEGAPGLHFITMNRSTATLEVHASLGLRGPPAAPGVRVVEPATPR
jgi:methylenetetrahydrofolate reductase (NADPH)